MQSNLENFHSYLPITDNNLRWDIYLTGIGMAQIKPGQIYPPKGHPEVYNFSWKTGRILPEYQIIIIAQGKGIFESMQTKQVEISKGNIIFLFPGIWHRYRPYENSGWKEYWLSWNGERLYRMTQKGILNPSEPVSKAQNTDDVMQSFNKIMELVKSRPAENPNILSAYAMEILALTMENKINRSTDKDANLSDTYNKSVDDPMVFQAVQMIWNHSHRNFQIDDVIETLPVTRRTLERKFREVLNCSIGSEITRCRIERAKQMLSSTTLPIKQVALAAGFSSTNWMTKVFKSQLGTTPLKYKKNSKSSH